MDHVLNWIWQGTLIAAAAFVCLRALDRSRAATRYALCWVALIAVLVLPLVPLWHAGGDPVALERAATPAGSIVDVPNAWWTSWPVVAALGLWWLSVFGIRLASALRHVRAARARCRTFPVSVESQLVYWKALDGRGRRTHLAVLDDAGTAHVLGCGAPIIAVAPTLVEHLSAEELDRVVIHEWAHVQRRDDLLSLAQLGVRAIAGWHPAVWWLDRQLIGEREAACDETVVALTGSAKAYAGSLTKVASLRPAGPMSLAAVGALSSSGLSRRVMRILSQKTFLSRRWSMAASLAVMVSLAALSFGIVGVRLIGLAAPASAIVRAEAVQTQAPEPGTPLLARPARSENTTPKSARVPNRLPATTKIDQLPTGAHAVTAQPPADVTIETPGASGVPQDQRGALSATPLPLGLAGLAVHRAAEGPMQPPARTATSETETNAETSPWAAAADAGVAIGRGSQKAGAATASFISRIGKKIGRSF